MNPNVHFLFFVPSNTAACNCIWDCTPIIKMIAGGFIDLVVRQHIKSIVDVVRSIDMEAYYDIDATQLMETNLAWLRFDIDTDETTVHFG